MALFRKRQNLPSEKEADRESGDRDNAEKKARLKRGTKTRRVTIGVVVSFYLLAIIFLILVEIGNIRRNTILDDIYIFKLDLSNILPQSAPTGLSLQNSVAKTLGLHDFYQVGLWNFCEGYNDGQGVTHCSKPNAAFWFNPVKIILDELLSGASIALPSEINDILNILRIAFHIMFGFFLGGLVLDAVLLVSSPIVLYSRWWSLPAGILSGLAALVVVVGAILGTVIAYVFRAALNSQPDLGVDASIGTRMIAFQWTAAGFNLLAFLIHAGLGCCCTSRRDLRTGRKGGRATQQSAGPASQTSSEIRRV
ncbi:SUR7/PalI family-domain-containing protein [Xylaria sp. FL1042]|nr:SUR7/PalI family-domain-containing protein [Xylaria sp. FL1042]